MNLKERIELLAKQFYDLTRHLFKIADKPPQAPGVYVGLRTCENPPALKIIYIGSSNNIAKRLSSPNHPLKSSDYNTLMCCECESYQQVEHKLLISVNTVLNIHRKNWKRNAK